MSEVLVLDDYRHLLPAREVPLERPPTPSDPPCGWCGAPAETVGVQYGVANSDTLLCYACLHDPELMEHGWSERCPDCHGYEALLGELPCQTCYGDGVIDW